MRKILLLLLAVILVLAAVTVTRALGLDSRQLQVAPLPPRPVPLAALADTLSQAIALRTVSYQEESQLDTAAFAALHQLLADRFPRVQQALEREVVSGWSLFYRWPGSDPSLAPVLLTGHLDVVPVDPDTTGAWLHPPFAGEQAEGYVWGRGAIDDKGGVITVLGAVESLLEQGFAPRRSVWLFFGQDEEASGRQGAAGFAARLEKEGVHPYLLLDEGLPLADGIFPGIKNPVAMIRIAEKGYLTLELAATADGGHSSMPPRQTAVGIVAQALARLEAHPQPARLDGAAAQMFAYLAPELPLGQRLFLANRWLFGPLVLRSLLDEPSSAAMVRTTTAATVFQGGVKENQLPSRATALVNFRLLPGDSAGEVIERVRRAVEDPRVSIRPTTPLPESHPPSEVEGAAFETLMRTAREVIPDAVVVPALLVGTSDARYYERFCRNVYGFRPFLLNSQDLKRFHGLNERVALSDLERMVRFYARLIEATSQVPKG